MMKERQHHDGLYKRCDCPRRTWAKCPHSWHFAFKWRGTRHRFSLDHHLGRRIDNKTEAETEAEHIRIAIREGRLGQPAPRAEMTLQQLADVYLERFVQVERKTTEESFRGALRTICRTVIPRPVGGDAKLGDWRVTDIATDTVERFREIRRGQGVSPAGVNRNLQSLRAMFNWAIRVGYLESTPFKRHSLAVVKISKADEPPRARRLNPDTNEEAQLLAACGPHLRAVVECALETGMRRGEILSLQWSQIEGATIERDEVPARDLDLHLLQLALKWVTRAEIVLPASKTKTRRDRRIPISTRLRAVLAMRRFDPKGDPLPADASVFGNAIGQRVGDVGRAWETAVLRSHSQQPKFTETCNLTAESRGALAAIDLHFHDLRREAGSRWLEGGVPIHVVRDWLGHTSIAQTSTYLAGSVRVQHDAMTMYEQRRAGADTPVERGGESGVSVALCGTSSGTGGRKSSRSSKRATKTPNENADGRETRIM